MFVQSDPIPAVIRSFYKALDDGDASALTSSVEPSFVLRTPASLPCGLGGSFDLAEGVLQDHVFRRVGLFDLQTQIHAVAAVDQRTLQVSGEISGFCRSTGFPLAARFVDTFVLEGDRISECSSLTDTAVWISAAKGSDRSSAPGFPGPALHDLERLEFRTESGLATLTLARPDRRNALDLQTAEEFLAVARSLQADPSLRVVLIRGEGDHFCVGGDVGYFQAVGGDGFGALAARMAATFHEAMHILSRLDAPIIAAVRGSVVGAGLSIACAADIVIASEDATFSTVFTGIGLSGDSGLSWHLPRMIGSARARRMYLQNLTLDASTALEWGLVAEVVPPPELEMAGMALASKLAAGPTIAFAHQRHLLHGSWSRSLSEQLDAEMDAVAVTAATSDARGALAAFIDRRRPRFEGR